VAPESVALNTSLPSELVSCVVATVKVILSGKGAK